MTVSADTILDRHILESLDFDHVVPCEPPDQDCEEKARWVYISKCCGHSEFLCDDHKEDSIRLIETMINFNVGLLCTVCRHRYPNTVQLSDVATYTPLKET